MNGFRIVSRNGCELCFQHLPNNSLESELGTGAGLRMPDEAPTVEHFALRERLRRLKHLKKTRMLSLDDGQFVRAVVAQMNREIAKLEAELSTLQLTELNEESDTD